MRFFGRFIVEGKYELAIAILTTTAVVFAYFAGTMKTEPEPMVEIQWSQIDHDAGVAAIAAAALTQQLERRNYDSRTK